MLTAIFGGAFDPPHLGHVMCAMHARLVGGADEVWVLPSARHPYHKPLTPFVHRLELCRLAFADLPFVQVREDELANPDGYTIGLVELLRAAHPGRRWLLVGGSDTARDLPNWQRGAELAALVRVHAVPRGGFDDQPGALPAISSSQVRSRLAAGQDCRGLVPAAVLARIAAAGWYRG
ncbi:MAG: nicotinate-nicotinamide nucleotide adenylyltransferase [Planctomycetes bacterium]|nr:nicotinate-nicotinamide nucleotide adenylyltransferase [Planctomycetota bacterium]